MGKQILIYVLGSLSIFLIVTKNTLDRNNSVTTSAVTHYTEIMARNTSNSLCEMLIAKLADSITYRANSWTNKAMFSGTSKYRIVDTLISSDSLIKISVKGIYLNSISNVEALVKKYTSGNPGFFPSATVKAAITTNNPVETLGTLTVDGRDHDINGNLLLTAGTYAIWTTSTCSRGGSSTLGSTVGGVDNAPAKVENNNVRLESQVYAGGYPNNPDDILGGSANGFPAGTLKAIAQSGYNGSQYVTDPVNLTYPLKGVTYVELPSGAEWLTAAIEGSGVLIVHNSAVNAKVKNMNSGVFKGLFIADDIIHVHSTIIGAVVGLSPSPSEGNCIGNGSGNIIFSREAITKGTTKIKEIETVGYGFNRKRLDIISWFE